MYKKIIVTLFICIIFITGCGCEKKGEQNDKYTVNEGVLKEKKVGNLEIFDIEMELTEDGSVFTIYFKNISNETIDIKKFKLYFKDKDGNQLLNEPKELDYDQSIQPDETQCIIVAIDKNLSEAVDVDYEIIQ